MQLNLVQMLSRVSRKFFLSSAMQKSSKHTQFVAKFRAHFDRDFIFASPHAAAVAGSGGEAAAAVEPPAGGYVTLLQLIQRLQKWRYTLQALVGRSTPSRQPLTRAAPTLAALHYDYDLPSAAWDAPRPPAPSAHTAAHAAAAAAVAAAVAATSASSTGEGSMGSYSARVGIEIPGQYAKLSCCSASVSGASPLGMRWAAFV